jgi:hypothetical protein
MAFSEDQKNTIREVAREVVAEVISVITSEIKKHDDLCREKRRRYVLSERIKLAGLVFVVAASGSFLGNFAQGMGRAALQYVTSGKVTP